MPILAISRQPVLHPGELADSTLFLNTPFDFFERANSYTCPLGPKPGSAWILMLRVVQDRLDVNAFHELRWADGTNLLTIPSLSIVKSTTMNIARAGDADAARLVEFRDKRHQLGMFSSIDAQYNVRIPAPSTTSGTGLYYTDSLNSGSTWTWQTLVTNVWASLPSTAGTAPTLPYTPDDKPEGFRFIGVNAWEALHVVLKKIGCTTAYDPIADTFSYVRLGTTQAGLAASLTGLTNRLMYDYDPGSDFQLGNMPETVRVFFHRREEAHGWERDTPDSSNWEMTPAVSKDRATSITGVLSGSVKVVWDDLPALFDAANVNSNSAALQTRANEIGDNIRDRIDVSEERFRRMYSGLVEDILPGSEVSEVRWRDFGDETGLVTEIVRIPLSEGSAFFELKRNAATGGGFVGEKLETTDLARGTHPLWPRLAQTVQVDDGASADGAKLTANVDGLFDGFVHRWANGAWTQLEACWIRPVNLATDNDEDTVVKLRQKDRFVGKLSGIETSGGTTQPVYAVHDGGITGGLPIGAVICDVLLPIEDGTTDKYYIDRDGVLDTDWALMDGKSNLTPGSGVAVWDRKGTDSDTFFVRAKDSLAVANNTAAGRTVPSGDPNVDVITLQDHNDHTHEILELCEKQFVLGTGADPKLCAFEIGAGGACDTECTSVVRDPLLCSDPAPEGVLVHAFDNGQRANLKEFLVTPPNKQLHWFERVA